LAVGGLVPPVHAAQAIDASGATTRPAATGRFFRVTQVDGTWWLLDPAGQRFISKGVTTVRFAQDRARGTDISPYAQTNQAKYGSEDAWRSAVAPRLIGWGFNTLGAWSDERLSAIDVNGRHLAYAPTLGLGSRFVRESVGGNAWSQGIFPDVFDPRFEATVRQSATERCAPRRDDPWVLGWFTDNELHWGPDWRGTDELLTMFLAMPAAAPGRAAAIALLRERYRQIDDLNTVWKTSATSWDELASAGAIQPPAMRKQVYVQNQDAERQINATQPARAAFLADCDEFAGRVAEQYFRLTRQAIIAADPNHLIFGCRFAYVPPKPVVDAAGKYLDAISFNCYMTDPRRIVQQYSAFGKPVIIGEFSFRGEDSGLPNTKGAGPKVKDQAERAAAFEQYIRYVLSDPHVVGYHWFEHADQPHEGRPDGENSNYGLVNIKDEPYETLVATMTRVNAQAEQIHAQPNSPATLTNP
jgi:agarase